MIVLLDPGHASSTPGKRSPDSSFFEWKFNRDIVKRISRKLTSLGIENHILVPENDVDVPLSVRAERANEIARKVGKQNCLFLSIHSNAAGTGKQWMNARGWCCYTSKGYTKSDKYAEIFMKEAEKIIPQLGSRVRKYSNTKYSWEEDFTVLKKTICPAILTESLFYDNRQDLAILQSERGREAIVNLHINAIQRIIAEK